MAPQVDFRKPATPAIDQLTMSAGWLGIQLQMRVQQGTRDSMTPACCITLQLPAARRFTCCCGLDFSNNQPRALPKKHAHLRSHRLHTRPKSCCWRAVCDQALPAFSFGISANYATGNVGVVSQTKNWDFQQRHYSRLSGGTSRSKSGNAKTLSTEQSHVTNDDKSILTGRIKHDCRRLVMGHRSLECHGEVRGCAKGSG